MLSNNLMELRKEKGLTLEDLAEAIGTSRQTIHRYENGTITNIPPEKVVLLAKALDTSPARLMGWEENSTFSRFCSVERTRNMPPTSQTW